MEKELTQQERRKQFIQRINASLSEEIIKNQSKEFEKPFQELINKEHEMNKRIEENIARNEEKIAKGRERIKDIGPIL